MTVYYRLFKECHANEFIAYWEQFYYSKIPDQVYQANLNIGGELTQSNIDILWRWKNERYGIPKIAPTNRILPEINTFRRLPTTTEEAEQSFWQKASTVSASGITWQVFIFHIVRPEDYPILDQHVMRAFLCLREGYVYLNPKQISSPCRSYPRFRTIYYPYRDFFFKLMKEGSCSQPKAADRALWAFGKHLKRLYQRDGPLIQS
jgi:hypothetical protein